LHRYRFSNHNHSGDASMPFLLGATTAATTLLSMACGQISTGFAALGVLLGAAVLMTWRQA
jgi:hypothetical protein